LELLQANGSSTFTSNTLNTIGSYPDMYPDKAKAKHMIRSATRRGAFSKAYKNDYSNLYERWKYDKNEITKWLSTKEFHVKGNCKIRNSEDAADFSDTSRQWRDVPGYEGYYCVSIFGEIANLRTGRILKATPTTWGYMGVTLTKNGEARKSTIHKIVALAFIGERPTEKNGQLYDINHIDGDKTNNALSNLEYVTKSENIKHMYSMYGW
jgi:hypothetical protein